MAKVIPKSKREKNCVTMELWYLALMLVAACVHVHAETGDDSSCSYEDAGEWSACYPRTKQQTMAQFLVDGEDSCPQTKTITKPCTPEEDPVVDSSCSYEDAGEWSACYPRTKQQTMAQFLVDGEDSCPQTKTITKPCTPEETDATSEEEPNEDDENASSDEDDEDPGEYSGARGRKHKRGYGRGHARTDVDDEDDEEPREHRGTRRRGMNVIMMRTAHAQRVQGGHERKVHGHRIQDGGHWHKRPEGHGQWGLGRRQHNMQAKTFLITPHRVARKHSVVEGREKQERRQRTHHRSNIFAQLRQRYRGQHGSHRYSGGGFRKRYVGR
ncbi:uncharacterized protein LOC124139154 [Haliotis rufescens]|uniref:uncharacterized protein LOC124139154 n=1 Tax=Haliotis rufescens TaxID=6454 RepID=UPI00201F6120|nr:uncharacterized protein LOC124139154 [Haliotis rufescens]